MADADGESYYVAAVGDGWRTSRTGTATDGRQTVRRFWNAEQRQVSEEVEPSDYDPRRRPWFFPALSATGEFWTSPYKFYDRNDVGITASMATRPAAGEKQLVVAFDILLDDLFREIQRMAPSANSRVFIFRRDAQLYLRGSDDASPDFKPFGEVGDPLVKKVVASWVNEHPPAGKTFSIRHDDGTWWCGFRPLEQGNRNVWVGIIVPESDITGGTLLIGVTDSGAITGLRRITLQTKTSADSIFKNLINQHIGAELTKYLRFRLVDMDDKQVGVVSCSRSSEPVFLKTAKSEAFFIRSGPSSDELHVSKVVAYVRSRS